MRRRPASGRGWTPVIRAWLRPDAEEELPWVLAGLPVLGCELEGDEQALQLTVYVAGNAPGAADKVARELTAAGAWGLERAELAHRDWLAAYRETVQPFLVGDLWFIDPHPDEPTPAPPGRSRLVVEPRMAFGSGSHESTQLVLLELEARSLAGARVLDVGTGSAILALAAAARGGGRIIALDVDPVAVLVARQVLAQQEIDVGGIRLLVAPVASVGETDFDLILCNMIPQHSSPLLGDLSRLLATDGELVLSGLLLEHELSLEIDLRKVGLLVAARRQLGEWVSLVARRRPVESPGGRR